MGGSEHRPRCDGAPASAARDWDAATYDRVSDPQLAWAREQLERLELTGGEVVLDAGCGSGRVTALLADLVPRGRVYAVDVAPSMVAHAREALGDRATVLCQDLVELELPERVDAIFSNATFHWIHDHDALFARARTDARARRPARRPVRGAGQHRRVPHARRRDRRGAAVRAVLRRLAASVELRHADAETADATGARRVRPTSSCWLEPKAVTPQDPRAFIHTVCLVRHLDPLPPELRESFVDRVLERAGDPLVLDYVRLNMTARVPS